MVLMRHEKKNTVLNVVLTLKLNHRFYTRVTKEIRSFLFIHNYASSDLNNIIKPRVLFYVGLNSCNIDRFSDFSHRTSMYR